MARQIFVFIHRWVGLSMSIFLIIVGLTGAARAFREEPDLWLNPELLTVTKRDAPLLDGNQDRDDHRELRRQYRRVARNVLSSGFAEEHGRANRRG